MRRSLDITDKTMLGLLNPHLLIYHSRFAAMSLTNGILVSGPIIFQWRGWCWQSTSDFVAWVAWVSSISTASGSVFFFPALLKMSSASVGVAVSVFVFFATMKWIMSLMALMMFVCMSSYWRWWWRWVVLLWLSLWNFHLHFPGCMRGCHAASRVWLPYISIHWPYCRQCWCVWLFFGCGCKYHFLIHVTVLQVLTDVSVGDVTESCHEVNVCFGWTKLCLTSLIGSWMRYSNVAPL